MIPRPVREPDDGRYSCGMDLKGPDGIVRARVAVDAKPGDLHLSVGTSTTRADASMTLDLSPLEADELAGALRAGARAARADERNVA